MSELSASDVACRLTLQAVLAVVTTSSSGTVCHTQSAHRRTANSSDVAFQTRLMSTIVDRSRRVCPVRAAR